MQMLADATCRPMVTLNCYICLVDLKLALYCSIVKANNIRQLNVLFPRSENAILKSHAGGDPLAHFCLAGFPVEAQIERAEKSSDIVTAAALH
jgi:hypothetical protein